VKVIAIDGPAGSGKSTVAKALAVRLGLEYLDTGAMYRAVTFAALRRGLDPADAEPSYTRSLLGDANLRAKKLGEEAIELALACAHADRSAVAREAADVLYHVLVAARATDVRLVDILRVLQTRSARAAGNDEAVDQ
jgi:cytidylate kinase